MSFWKTIPGFPAYEVSAAGQVRRGIQYLRPRKNADGYLRVNLYQGGKASSHYVHVLVLLAFVGPRPTGAQARHRNGKADDARLSNLAWGSPTENGADKAEHGTAAGSRNPNAKLTEEAVSAIRSRYQPRSRVNGTRAIAREMGLSRETVSRIVRGQTWNAM